MENLVAGKQAGDHIVFACTFDLTFANVDVDPWLFHQSPVTVGKLQPSLKATRSTVWTKVRHCYLDSYRTYVLTSAGSILVLLPIDCTFDLEVPYNFGRFIRDNVSTER